MKKSILSILLALLPFVANAESVKIDGIWYNLIKKAQEAEVTWKPNQYAQRSRHVLLLNSIIYNYLLF